MKILVIEDNLELAQNMTDYLQREGHVCELADNHHRAVNKLDAFSYDCLVLDIMLPDGNGLDILRYIKHEKIDSCVLIVSAKNALDDKVAGLELGADDYLTKPFHLSELNARLKALYRRKYTQGDKEIKFAEIFINIDTMETIVAGKPMELTRKEYELLVYLDRKSTRLN